jgi:hypothetical protein
MLERAKRASHIDPLASSYAIMRRARPYRGENPEPGKDVHGELDPRPGIREQPGSISDIVCTATTIYEYVPHALSVVHQMIMLPPRIKIANNSHP